MPRGVQEKLVTVAMLDVHIPSIDARELCLIVARRTEPSAEVAMGSNSSSQPA